MLQKGIYLLNSGLWFVCLFLSITCQVSYQLLLGAIHCDLSNTHFDENDVLISKWQAYSKKIWVLLSGVEPKTFWLLVQMLYQ